MTIWQREDVRSPVAMTTERGRRSDCGARAGVGSARWKLSGLAGLSEAQNYWGRSVNRQRHGSGRARTSLRYSWHCRQRIPSSADWSVSVQALNICFVCLWFCCKIARDKKTPRNATLTARKHENRHEERCSIFDPLFAMLLSGYFSTFCRVTLFCFIRISMMHDLCSCRKRVTMREK